MLAFFLGQPLFGDLRWCLRDLWVGILASLPLLALFFWLLHSSLPALERLDEFLDTHVRTIFEAWPIWQLAVISLLAGVCEEVFFRSVIQGGLARHIGTIPGLAVASVIFGMLSLSDKDLCADRYSHRRLPWDSMDSHRKSAGAHRNPRGL